MFEPYRPPTQPQRTRPAGQPGGPQETAKKAAVGTVTVIAVLIGLFCVAPTVLCLVMGLLGQLGASVIPDPTP